MQVQGLMYIFDAEWCNLYIWTPARGSAGARASQQPPAAARAWA